MEEGAIFLINDADILSGFRLHYGRKADNPNKTCLRPCFQVKTLANKDFKLIPGYQTFNLKFYHCPMSAIYIQINELQFFLENPHLFNAQVVVFSKDFLKQKAIELKIYTRLPHYIMYLNDYINALNKYIDMGNDLDLLDEVSFQMRSILEPSNEISLLNIINNLSFKFYENDFVRVGKDNKFWNEIEITSLPQSSYLTDVILESLLNSKGFDSVSYVGNKEAIIIVYGSNNGYCPASGRKELGPNLDKEQEVKDCIKLKINNFYNADQEINERLRKAKS
jgi:hypothetical protein